LFIRLRRVVCVCVCVGVGVCVCMCVCVCVCARARARSNEIVKYNFCFSVKKLVSIHAVYQHWDWYPAEFTKSTSGTSTSTLWN